MSQVKFPLPPEALANLSMWERLEAAKQPRHWTPEDFGTTGLQDWVNSAHDLDEFKDRRELAESIILRRLGSYSAMIFVERLCDERPAARRQVDRQNESWRHHVELARHWAVFIKDALIAGRPSPIIPNFRFEHTARIAYEIAIGQCPFAKI